MVPVLSTLYRILPKKIKNNPKMVELVQRFNNNNKLKEIESHYRMLDLIFANCDIKAKGVMRDIQLLSLELLRLFDNICKKHNLNYWLDYGTLLGAVRHRGFIPWDDDIDIGMIREDYNKLVKVFPDEISKIEGLEENLIISKLTEPHKNYPEECNELDILNNGTFILFFQCAYKKPFVHFDVFPKDYISDEGLTSDRNTKQTQLQVELRNNINNGKYSFEEGLKQQNDEMKFTNKKTDNVSDAIDGLHNNIQNRLYKTEYIFPLSKIGFEGYEFSCPNNKDKYLPLIYGPEYMHIPHIALDHNTVNFVKDQYNNIKEDGDKGFKEAINFLKKVNDNFK